MEAESILLQRLLLVLEGASDDNLLVKSKEDWNGIGWQLGLRATREIQGATNYSSKYQSIQLSMHRILFEELVQVEIGQVSVRHDARHAGTTARVWDAHTVHSHLADGWEATQDGLDLTTCQTNKKRKLNVTRHHSIR